MGVDPRGQVRRSVAGEVRFPKCPFTFLDSTAPSFAHCCGSQHLHAPFVSEIPPIRSTPSIFPTAPPHRHPQKKETSMSSSAYRDSRDPTNRRHVHFAAADTDDPFVPSSLSLHLKLGPAHRPTVVLKISVYFEHGRLPRIKVRTSKPREEGRRRRRREWDEEGKGRVRR